MYLVRGPQTDYSNWHPGLAGTANTVLAGGSAVASASSVPIAAALSISVPVVGAVIAGISIAIGAWLNRRGPAQRVATTKIVNEAEPFLKQNVDAYLNGPRTAANQAAALQNFDVIWARVMAECDQPQFGNPGQACINDRKEGSTKGYDWFQLYRYPIAHDTTVQPDPVSGGFFDFGLQPAGGNSFSMNLLFGLGLLTAALVIPR